MRGPPGRTTMMKMTMIVTTVKTKIAQRTKNTHTHKHKRIITTSTTCSVAKVYI